MILYYIISYYIKLYYIILYYIILFYIISYYIISYYIILYYIILYHIILYYILFLYLSSYVLRYIEVVILTYLYNLPMICLKHPARTTCFPFEAFAWASFKFKHIGGRTLRPLPVFWPDGLLEEAAKSKK